MFKIISMYTPDTPYEEEIKDLGKSCHQFGLESKFYPIKNLKDWVRNTQQKASVIQQALEEFECDVVWLDADAVILKKLELFEDLAKNNDFHLCIHRAYYESTEKEANTSNLYIQLKNKVSAALKKNRHPKGEILSGTIYFNNSIKTKQLVDEWVELNKHKIEWDQRTLQEVIDRDGSPYIVQQLPRSYVKIVPRHQTLNDLDDGNNHIGHKQLSRIYKNKL